MFSRLFTNARNILSRSPSVQDIPSASTYELKDSSPTVVDELDTGMVTTRRGTDTESPAVDDSGAKSALKRGWEEPPSPISSIKRRKYTGKETDADGNIDVDQKTGNQLEIHDTIAVKAPVRAQNEDGEETEDKLAEPNLEDATPKQRGKLALRGKNESSQERRSSPKVVIEKRPKDTKNNFASKEASANIQPSTDPESVYSTPVTERPTSVYTTPATQRKKAESLPPKREPPPSAEEEAEGAPVTSAEKKNGKKQNKGSMENMVADKSPPQPFPTQPAKPTHIRFSSEEPPPPADSAPAASIDPEIPSSTFDSEQQGLPSDDEAPETVTRASALEATKAAEAETTKAVKTLEAAAKLKRREHALRLAEQASARRKEKKDQKKPASNATLPQFDLTNLPALLPDSLLAAAPLQRPATPPPAPLQPTDWAQKQQQKRSQHIKFLERGEPRVKDVKRGPVSVHVLGQQNPLLAPKMNRDSRNVREAWLKGRTGRKGGRFEGVGSGKLERRKVGGGFLRK